MQGQPSAPALEKERRSVARLRIHRENIPDETASCVFVGNIGRSFYCATAYHAVAAKDTNRQKSPVSWVRLQTYGNPEELGADVMSTFDPALDLGVVRVTLATALDSFRVGRAEPRADQTIRIVGHPSIGDWSVWHGSIRNENGRDDVSHFAYTGPTTIEDGFSGGGIFDAKLQLLGLHTSSSQQYGIGLKVGDVQRVLTSWQVPTNFLVAGRLETVTRMWRSPGLNVDCNRTNAGTLQASVALDPEFDERVISVTASYENVSNIKDQTGPTIVSSQGPIVTVRYGFNGLDAGLFGCPGGGHATVAVTFTIQRFVLGN